MYRHNRSQLCGSRCGILRIVGQLPLLGCTAGICLQRHAGAGCGQRHRGIVRQAERICVVCLSDCHKILTNRAVLCPQQSRCTARRVGVHNEVFVCRAGDAEAAVAVLHKGELLICAVFIRCQRNHRLLVGGCCHDAVVCRTVQLIAAVRHIGAGNRRRIVLFLLCLIGGAKRQRLLTRLLCRNLALCNQLVGQRAVAALNLGVERQI